MRPQKRRKWRGQGEAHRTRFPAILAAQGGRRSSMETTLTIRQAAEALGVSPRTLRRRLEAGDLSYTRTLRGQRQVVEIDGAELARFAQGNGFTLRQPAEMAEGTLGATEGTEGQTVAGAPSETEGTGGKLGANGGKRGQTEGTEGQTVATEGAQLGALGAERIAALEAQLRAAERERDFLRRIVEDLAEALKVKTLPPVLQVEQIPARAQEEQPLAPADRPQVLQVEQPPAQADPAPAEQPPGEGRRPRSWWSRLWGRGD